MSLLQQKYLANSLRLVPECSPSMEAGPRGSWSDNIWSHEADRDEDLFILGPQSRRTLLICKVGLPTFLNLI